MTVGAAPMCVNCKHFHDEKGATCDAFPEGIPDEIYIEGHDHRKPFKGDNGIRFESGREFPIKAIPIQ